MRLTRISLLVRGTIVRMYRSHREMGVYSVFCIHLIQDVIGYYKHGGMTNIMQPAILRMLRKINNHVLTKGRVLNTYKAMS